MTRQTEHDTLSVADEPSQHVIYQFMHERILAAVDKFIIDLKGEIGLNLHAVQLYPGDAINHASDAECQRTGEFFNFLAFQTRFGQLDLNGLGKLSDENGLTLFEFRQIQLQFQA